MKQLRKKLNNIIPYITSHKNNVILGAILLSLPVTLVMVQNQTSHQSSAAGEAFLEAETGTLSGGVSIENDSLASGGKYIVFTNPVTPTTAPPTLTPAGTTSTPPPVPLGLRAFPGAVGYGKDTTGGRGGRVIYVTNLNNSGSGSLRDALTATGTRIVLFKVAGTIQLSSMIEVGPASGNLTIAGQTAPNGGVQVKGGMIKFTTKNVIVRYLKVRPGGEVADPSDEDAIALQAYQPGEEVANIIIDHSTLTWGTDLGGIAMLKNVHDVTVSNSILGEGMMLSNHGDVLGGADGHSMALSIFELSDHNNGWGRNITIYGNLLTTSNKRMPEVSGAENLDFISNVIYNWRDTGPNGNPRKMNFMNNKILPGPMSIKGPYYNWRSTSLHWTGPRANAVYEGGNSYEQRSTCGLSNNTYGGAHGGDASAFVSTMFSPLSVTSPMSADQAYTYVANGSVGANLPLKDRADQETFTRLQTCTGVFFNAETEPQLPHPQWPDLTTVGASAPADTDNDGMGDTWEIANFGSITGSRSTADNSSADADGDGYTDLEEYLNKTNPNVTN